MMADRADALSVIRPLGRVSIQARLRPGSGGKAYFFDVDVPETAP